MMLLLLLLLSPVVPGRTGVLSRAREEEGSAACCCCRGVLGLLPPPPRWDDGRGDGDTCWEGSRGRRAREEGVDCLSAGGRVAAAAWASLATRTQAASIASWRRPRACSFVGASVVKGCEP